ncbi:hypothetical protein BD410DRAFT_790871 [Rickenella mellea]|uniref:Uncharacterized protein n=1 Tax=Rickenella mellea TaxID=50990 RepID=A0A4Y7PZG1_9AGAM|nr:hypothetical protein BD410DRAFT_790871 [Rickenella mellea]
MFAPLPSTTSPSVEFHIVLYTSTPSSPYSEPIIISPSTSVSPHDAQQSNTKKHATQLPADLSIVSSTPAVIGWQLQ